MVSDQKIQRAAEILEKLEEKGWDAEEFVGQLETWEELEKETSSVDNDDLELPLPDDYDEEEDTFSSRSAADDFVND